MTPVNIKEHPKINEWLSQVEKEMHVTLARLLALAVQDISAFKTTNIDQAAYMQMLDKFPAQLVVLAAQILWSESVDASLTGTISRLHL